MRKLIYVLIILILQLPVVLRSHGAYLFNGSSSYIAVTDNDVLDLPDGDWTYAGWVKLTSNSGTVGNIIFDWGDTEAGQLRFNCYDTSHASYPNDFIAWLTDTDRDGTANVGDGDNNDYFSSNTAWTHIIVQRSGTTFTTYKNNASPTSRVSAPFNGLASNDSFYIGAGNSGTLHYMDGSLAEWARWDRALNADERAGLAKGISPDCYGGRKVHFPMIREYIEPAAGLSMSNSGSTITDHPRLLSCS